MALLVTDQGEIDSLRTLLNATHKIPRNLVLKLYTSDTTPAESDVPSATAGSEKYYEPYDATNNLGYGSAPTTGYPLCVDNRTEEDQNFGQQYGILLNGNRWSIATTVNPVATTTFAGTNATYSITVADATDIKKGDYAEGAGIPANTYVVDIQGLVIEISQQLTATANAGTAVSFGRGRTTASYPEQVFTFTSAAGSVYGYYLARANNMPVTLHGVLDGGSVAAGSVTILEGGSGYTAGELLYFDREVIGGAYSSGVTIQAADITDATNDYVQITGVGTATGGYYRITNTNDKQAIGIARTAGDPTISVGEYATVIGRTGAISAVSPTSTPAKFPATFEFTLSENVGLVVGHRIRLLDSNNNNKGDFLVSSVNTADKKFSVSSSSDLSGHSSGFVLKHGMSATNASADELVKTL